MESLSSRGDGRRLQRLRVHVGAGGALEGCENVRTDAPPHLGHVVPLTIRQQQVDRRVRRQALLTQAAWSKVQILLDLLVH